MMIVPPPSPFPPSFEGNPLAYGFGLFGDVVGASLAMTMLFGYCFEATRGRRVSRMLGNELSLPPMPLWSPVHLYWMGKASILLFVVMRTLPDAIWMLAWGEVTEETIRAVLAVDLWLDGLAIAPLIFSAFCWSWGRQVIPQKLMSGYQASIKGPPPWAVIVKNGRIILAVFLISIGVTFGKVAAEQPKTVFSISYDFSGKGK